MALAGGVGGAKLVVGLAHCLQPGELVVGVNTGDDEDFHGLHISPDLDTMMYTLAGLSNPDTGWGLQGDTFEALSMLRRYGSETWFNLGDRDFATHILRTQLLGQGLSLSEVTGRLCDSLGVQNSIIPMSDQPVRTVLETPEGRLSMQEYFVQRRAQPDVSAVNYLGAGEAASICRSRRGAFAGPYAGNLPVQSRSQCSAHCAGLGNEGTAGVVFRDQDSREPDRWKRRSAGSCRKDNGRSGTRGIRSGSSEGLPQHMRRSGD